MNRISTLVCPTFGGSPNCDVSTPNQLIGAAQTNYQNFVANDPSGSGTVIGPAISNYIAMAASHYACLTFNPQTQGQQNPPTAEPANGCIITPPPTSMSGTKGLNFKAITDGMSKTIMVAESREPSFSSWYDGSVNYGVAIPPTNSNVQATQYQPQKQTQIGGPGNSGTTINPNWWIVLAGGVSAVNYGPNPGASTGTTPSYYVGSSSTPNINSGGNWSFGPSSQHTGGVVIHLYADGGVRNIIEDIDPTLYLQLVTRAGTEPAVPPGE